MIETLTQWACELMYRELNSEEFVSVNSSTAEGLLFQLQRYTQHLESDYEEQETSPWPLVRVIDHGLHHPLLNEGVTFTDAAGLSDSNVSRVQNARLHLRACAYVLVVGNIKRGLTEDDLLASLALGYRMRGSGHAMLVLTHADDIDEATTVTGTPAEKKELKFLDEKLKSLKSEKEKLKSSLAEKKGLRRRSQAATDQYGGLQEEKRSLTAEISRRTAERDTLRIGMRNRFVVKTMEAKYKAFTGDPRPLSAFAVAGKIYEKYMEGFSEEDKPFLPVGLTGLPDLRAKLFTLPTEGKLNSAMHIATVQLPNLLNTFELYCSKAHLSRKDTVGAIVLEPIVQLRGLVGEAMEATRNKASLEVLTEIQGIESHWVVEARKRCKAWSRKHTKDHLAMLKKRGLRKATRGKLSVNWDNELLQIAADEFSEPFHRYEESLFESYRDLKMKVSRLLNSTRSRIKDDPQFNILALQPFLDQFDREKPNLTRAMDRCLREQKQEVRAILERSISYSDDAFLVMAMEQIYEEVSALRGRGAPKRRCDLLESKVSRVWLQVHDSIEEAMNALADRYEKKLLKELERVFTTIHRLFVMLCDKNVKLGPADLRKEEALRERLKAKVQEARELVEGPLQEAVDECKKYGRDNSVFVV